MNIDGSQTFFDFQAGGDGGAGAGGGEAAEQINDE